MKILIIATPRSGSTSLIRGLGKILSLERIPEPFNRHSQRCKTYPYPIRENSVLKSIVDQVPKEYNGAEYFFKHFSKEFDNVIILGRRSFWDQYNSFISAVDSDIWHRRYIKVEHPFEKEHYESLTRLRQLLDECSEKLNIPITWYEDLYSGDKELIKKITDPWNLEFDFDKLYSWINPAKKYGQSPNQNKKSLL